MKGMGRVSIFHVSGAKFRHFKVIFVHWMGGIFIINSLEGWVIVPHTQTT